MRPSTPQWWYRRDRARYSATRLMLTPLSWVWTWVTARRLSQGRSADPGVPVICVGNLTMGGSGKTPVVRALAVRLRDLGMETHIVTRGFGGRQSGPVRVDAGQHTAAEMGDEAVMLAADGPVWVSRDRAAGAAAAVAAGAQIVVLDDGHQNPGIAKTLSIIVVDGETRDGEWPFGDGGTFPAGPMREPLGSGLGRADLVVLILPADLKSADPDLISLLQGKPVLIARFAPLGPPPDGPQLAFAGIGKPWKMERALRAAGCDLADFAPLPNHAAISERILGFLARRAAGLGAGLLTSEKDWVRLSPAWRAKVKFWPISVQFEDAAALDAWLRPFAPKHYAP